VIQARIEAMAHGGFGIARIDGIVHFVPETVTEDLVEIEPVIRKKRYIFSRMVRILFVPGTKNAEVVKSSIFVTPPNFASNRKYSSTR
jgi:predicted RNA-binding protein with TRAM domain